MEFRWISIFGFIIVVIMLIPNIIYGIKNKDEEIKYNNKLVNIIEQLGRYASIILTIFPIGINSFKTTDHMLIYLILNSILLIIYLIIWAFYLNSKNFSEAMLLAIIPTLIFLVCGIILNHWILIISSIIFGASHILITYKNNC